MQSLLEIVQVYTDVSAYTHTTPLCLHMCNRLGMCKSHCLPSCKEPYGSEWGLRDTSIHTGKLLSLPVVSGAQPGSPGRPKLGRSVPLSIQSSGVLRKMTSQNMELRFTPPEAHQNFNSVWDGGGKAIIIFFFLHFLLTMITY